jgi:iron complex outermembrane recepter protein
MNSKLSYAIAAILSGVTIGSAAFAADAPADTANDSLGEIIVTAQRRNQSIQDVPISMQAFTAESLAELNVTTFDDYLRYLPNVTTANNGPGQNEVFMRGLSAGAQPSQGSGSTAAFPNVAIYLDNQSGQLPGRNLDIYAADLARIEVLEGPQGTLFGSGAQAGVIRYITNEPKLNKWEGSVKAGYGVTAHGDPNTDVTAVINIPLIDDKLAIRGVIYNDQRGGYINNVPATFTRANTDIGIHYAGYPATGGTCPDGKANNGFCVPPNSQSINNYNIAANAINPVVYKGLRVEGLYKINDDWDVLISQSYQNMESQGVFYQQPTASDGAALNPLEVTLFNPSHNNDKFESTAWTVNGKIGALKAIYTGGFLVRKVDQVSDYTNYARGVYASYYQCIPAGPGVPEAKCFTPSAVWRSAERNEHLQNEFRLSTPDDWRLRGIGGVFLENNKLYDQSDWRYRSVPSCTSNGDAGTPGNAGCFSNIGTVPGTSVQSPGVRDSQSSFYQDDVREVKQTAFFFSADYDIIPKVLTATVGTRHYKFENSLKGSVNGSFFCYQQGNPSGGCQGTAYNLDAAGLSDTESGWKSRANVSWHITPDVMVYYTYSQGFRPGSFNQNGGTAHATGADGKPQYIINKSYQSDKLTNNEFGWKTQFLNNRVQWNGAIYQENWDGVQIALFDPGLLGNVFSNLNGPNYRIRGLETSVVARLARGLTVQGAASWNQSEQTNAPALINNNPDSAGFGQPIPATNPFGAIGSPSANAPPLQFSLRARYEWGIGDYSAFVQAGASHSGHSFTQAGANPTIAQAGAINTSRLRFELPAYSVYDASFGVARDQWTLAVFGENLANSHASTFTSTDQFIVAETPLRPRVIGLTMGYKF